MNWIDELWIKYENYKYYDSEVVAKFPPELHSVICVNCEIRFGDHWSLKHIELEGCKEFEDDDLGAMVEKMRSDEK